MNVALNPSTRYNYIQKCFDRIKSLFPIGFHTDPESIEKSCTICLDFFISEFETECEKIKSTADISFFMSSYSDMSFNEGKYPTPDYVIYRKLCKNVFGELTKLNITDNQTYNIDSTLISNLYYLTELIDQYTQHLYTYYMVNKNYFQLEVYEEYFGITLTDNQLANKIQNFSDQFDQSIYKTTCVDHSEISKFRDITELAFKETAEHFFNKVFPSDNSSVIIDLSQMSFSDFKNALDTNNISHDIKPTEIIVLTDSIRNSTNEFYAGLTLKSDNVKLEESVTRPHIMYRSRFRPIFEVKVNNQNVYISTPYIIFEALAEFILNEIPFAILPPEWKENEIMEKYAKKQKEEHDKWLEDAVESVLLGKKFNYLRNKKSINNVDLLKQPASKKGKFVGEIDFIIIDDIHKIVSVVDCKFMKTKYHFPTFAADKQSFTEKGNCYENKLGYKLDWVSNHLPDIQRELKLDSDITNYRTEAYFITNSFTFYSLFSKYSIVALQNLEKYLERIS